MKSHEQMQVFDVPGLSDSVDRCECGSLLVSRLGAALRGHGLQQNVRSRRSQ